MSSVRALVPQKFSVEEELMHIKHVEVKSPHVGVMWKFGRGVFSSVIEDCRLLYEPHFSLSLNFIFDLITVMECFSTKIMTKHTNCILRSLKKGIRDHRWPT
ncbi:hypothetical protein TNCV_876031 [Trichonephila clavipes]|nr:hypothetical protein TNCV_876031 [Trichonephila clavipes]